MPFSMSYSWEIPSYILFLLAFWTVVRFCVNYLTNLLQNLDDQPNKVIPFINEVSYAVSFWSERGGRPYQEDRHQELGIPTLKDASLYGVFDGHGGKKAAQYCREFLLKCIAEDTKFATDPVGSIYRSYVKINGEFSAKAKSQMLSDGTTATTAVIFDQKIYVGNAGDSRAVLVQKGGKARALSSDHRPDRKDEEIRIRKLGGRVVHWGRWRVEGILAVSRAIGDVSLQPYISCEPEIVEKAIEPGDDYLVLATDGLWDSMTSDDVAKFVCKNQKDFVNLGKKLCSEAMIMGSTDNITVLVIDLQHRIGKEMVKSAV